MTASRACRAGTSSPAAKTLTVRRPPDMSLMRLARRSAPTPRPGKFFGQAVTMRHSILPCERAGAGNAVLVATAPAPARAAPLRNLRRSILRFSPQVLWSSGLRTELHVDAHGQSVCNLEEK